MKKKYFKLLGLFFLTEIILLIISGFLRLPLLHYLLNLMLTIPISIFTSYCINALIWGPKSERYHEVKTSVARSEEFLQAQPYICEECGAFIYRFSEICENCGANNTLRKSTKMDYTEKILNK